MRCTFRIHLTIAALLSSAAICESGVGPAATEPAQLPRHSSKGQEAFSLFGHALANVGDQDGDGSDDLAVAAPLGWSEHGRTGAVLIVSPMTGKILCDLLGPPDDWEFGQSVWAIRAPNQTRATHLAVGARGQTPERGNLSVLRILSLDTRAVVAELDRVRSIRGSPGDFNGDGVTDYLCEFEVPSWFGPGAELRWYSGSDWMPIQAATLASGMDLLDEDYDGDSLADGITYSKGSSGRKPRRTVSLCSSRTGALIRLLGDPTPVSPPFTAAVSAGVNLNGKRAIVLCASDEDSTRQLHRLYSGTTGEEAFVSPCTCRATFGRVYDREFFPLPDINADGYSDFCELSTEFLDESVRAYCGQTMGLLWAAEEVLSEGTRSMSTLGVAREGGRPDRTLIAVGNVLDVHRGRAHAEIWTGEVVLLEASTGAVVKRLFERNYRDISYAAYRERLRGQKK